METFYFAKLYRSGTGLVFTIPVDIARGLQLGRGDTVAISVGSADTILFRKITNEEIKQIKPDTIKI